MRLCGILERGKMTIWRNLPDEIMQAISAKDYE